MGAKYCHRSYDTYNFSALAKDGFKRFSLYFTWKELEIGAADPNHPEGTVLEDQVDPVIKYGLWTGGSK